METEQSWKQRAARRIVQREAGATEPPVGEQGLGWARILAITVPCAGVGIAGGVALGSAVASPAAVAYLAAALFVAVLAFAIHVGVDTR